MLNVMGLLKQCEDFLESHVLHENVVGILKIARHLHCRRLERTALRYILIHFSDIVTQR
jgi:hypothetical protein